MAAKARGEYVEERRINPAIKAKNNTSSVSAEQPAVTQENTVIDNPVVSTTILLGQKMVLDKACETIQLRQSLSATFTQEETDSILALVYYTVCQGKAFSLSTDWLIEHGYAKLEFTSQSISVLLTQLTDDKINTFLNHGLRNKPKVTIYSLT